MLVEFHSLEELAAERLETVDDVVSLHRQEVVVEKAGHQRKVLEALEDPEDPEDPEDEQMVAGYLVVA